MRETISYRYFTVWYFFFRSWYVFPQSSRSQWAHFYWTIDEKISLFNYRMDFKKVKLAFLKSIFFRTNVTPFHNDSCCHFWRNKDIAWSIGVIFLLNKEKSVVDSNVGDLNRMTKHSAICHIQIPTRWRIDKMSNQMLE